MSNTLIAEEQIHQSVTDSHLLVKYDPLQSYVLLTHHVGRSNSIAPDYYKKEKSRHRINYVTTVDVG